MVKLEAFTVSFDQLQGVYYAGQILSGKVSIQLSEEMLMKGIILKLLGKGKVHWSESANKETKHYRAEEIYFEENFTLHGSDNQCKFVLPPGNYTYPFSFRLPTNLPSSFEGPYGYVRYVAEAKIDRPWKFDHVSKTAFTVLRTLDLNAEAPTLREPAMIQDSKVVSCCCCLDGLIEATIKIDRRCFVPGETIFVSGEVANNSNTDIRKITVKLKQYIEFFGARNSLFSSGNYHMKVAKESIASVERNRIEHGSSDFWNNMPLVVPALPPSRLEGCEIINIGYKLKITFDVDYNTFKMESDIVIGTVPLQTSFYQTPPQQQQWPIVSQPTAPPLNLEPERNFSCPPPSYEECVRGKVMIKEDGDSEFTRGNLSWAPMYPIYHYQPQDPNVQAPPYSFHEARASGASYLSNNP